MPNYRSEPRNILIKEVKERQEAIRLKCFDCMAGNKRADCHDETCPLFSFRPWAKKEINRTNYQKD